MTQSPSPTSSPPSPIYHVHPLPPPPSKYYFNHFDHTPPRHPPMESRCTINNRMTGRLSDRFTANSDDESYWTKPVQRCATEKPEERAGCSWRRNPRWLVWDGRGWTNWIRSSVWQKSYIHHWGRFSRAKCLRGVGYPVSVRLANWPITTNHSRNRIVVLSRPSIHTLVGMSSSSLHCDWLSFSFDGTIIVIVWLLWFLLSFELFSTRNYVSRDAFNLKNVGKKTSHTHTWKEKNYLKLRKRWKLLKCQWSLFVYF